MLSLQTHNLPRGEALRRLRLLSGKDLRPLAEQYHVTVWKNGHKNKGWAGQAIEQYLGLPQNSLQAPDFGSWELKVVPLVRTADGALRVKESMAITMLEPAEVLSSKFADSHLYDKLRSIESGQTTFLPATNWSATSFTSAPVWNFPPGWALATVFVSGIPGTSSVVNVSVPIPTATTLTGARRLTNGAFQCDFTNAVGALYGVLASTNVASPSSNWTALGGATEVAPGQFQFTDLQATNYLQRFYRVSGR